MKNKFEEFLKLHKKDEPLLIGNAWNAQSAKIFQQKGFKAIATSSGAVAETLGYSDGEEMDFDEYLFVVKHIASSVTIPFSVDLEGGYGKTPEKICKNLVALYKVGVSGINIEDSIMVKGKRKIVPAKTFTEKLVSIVKLLQAKKVKMFINVRVDPFLLGLPNALEDALSRVDAYQSTGVQGLFFPCIKNIVDIKKITEASNLPVNVMCIPGLPDFNTLQKANVKRISIGPFLNMSAYKQLETSIDKISHDRSFDSLFN